jgi:hypothetical protein
MKHGKGKQSDATLNGIGRTTITVTMMCKKEKRKMRGKIESIIKGARRHIPKTPFPGMTPPMQHIVSVHQSGRNMPIT